MRRNSGVESATNREIFGTLVMRQRGGNITLYIAGSKYEGTYTPGMQSDVDNLIVSEVEPLILDISHAPVQGLSLLLIQDEHTPHGYAKLQVVVDGVPLNGDQKDVYNRLEPDPFHGTHGAVPVFDAYVDKENRLTRAVAKGLILDGERHGPAFTGPARGDLPSQDDVFAFRCCSWPDSAQEWLDRPRHYGYPSADSIQKFKRLGFLVVAVGHPDSEEENLQWRISFTLQERLLVTRFNSVQLKCYILLKVIKKRIAASGNATEKTLTSYHCKTAMFYMIENTPQEYWTPENLIRCLTGCLQLIITWIDCGVIPNYFVVAENMCKKTFDKGYRDELTEVCNAFQAGNYEYIMSIECECIGLRFRLELDACERSEDLEISRAIRNFANYWLNAFDPLVFRNYFFLEAKINSADIREGVKGLENLVSFLREAEIPFYDEDDTQRVKNLILPHIWYCCQASLISSTAKGSKEMLWDYLHSEDWTRMSHHSDMYSCKLKQASLLCMLEQYDESLAILTDLENNFNYFQTSICICVRDKQAVDPIVSHHIAVKGQGLSTTEFIRQFTIPCVVYLPTENDLTPLALSYEMYRSFGMPPGTRQKGREVWLDWAVIDGKFLLYFLTYLNHRKLNLDVEATFDIVNMSHVVNTDVSLGHKETALNLLGWAYRQEGQVEKAKECFKKSILERPLHNAAYWHCCFLALEILKNPI